MPRTVLGRDAGPGLDFVSPPSKRDPGQSLTRIVKSELFVLPTSTEVRVP